MMDDSAKAKYFKRCYEVIDGLWFMKTEEEWDFERALEIDRRVWEIVPKIQARTLRQLTGLQGNGLHVLETALRSKAELDDAIVEIERDDEKFLRMSVHDCPWYRLMQKSQREHLAGNIGEVICGTEYPVWQREFGVNGDFSLKSKLCDGKPCCIMEFHS